MKTNLGNIKRYAFEHFALVECENGALVKYSDIEKIKEELRVLLEGKSTGKTSGELYISNCRKLSSCSTDCESCGIPEFIEKEILSKYE